MVPTQQSEDFSGTSSDMASSSLPADVPAPNKDKDLPTLPAQQGEAASGMILRTHPYPTVDSKHVLYRTEHRHPGSS